MTKTTSELNPDELNPRQITPEQLDRLKKSLELYGDLSGIVFNRRTRKLVGGHQRTSLFDPTCEIDCKYFDKPDKQGTVGVGHIVLKDGTRHGYREVDWNKEFAYGANVAANANGGTWNEEKLREVLVLAADDDKVQPDTIGLEDDFLEKLMRGVEVELNVQEQEAKALTEPLTLEEVKNLPSQTAMVQIFLTTATRPPFLMECKSLQVKWGTKNITETILKAVKECYASSGSV